MTLANNVNRTIDELLVFLDRIITTPEGFFCLSLAQQDGIGWADQWYVWPRDRERIAQDALQHADAYNVYFSSYLFQTQNRLKSAVLPTRTIQADLDEAVIADIPIPPTALVETSPGRHQAFWVLTEEVDLDTHETYSRKITYAIDKADHSGWPLGRTARMPYTYNFKYIDGPKDISIIASTNENADPVSFELLGEVENPRDAEDEEWVSSTNKPKPKIGPNELLEQLRADKKLITKIVVQYNVVSQDRSAALWALMVGLFRAGCDRNTVFWVARQSANNKFARLRYGGDKELAKDVVRAESVAQRKITNVRAHIREIRRQPGAPYLMHSVLANEITDIMRSEGDFIHTTDNNIWYVKRDTGKPMTISRSSEQFVALLDVHFGLNHSELSQKYVSDAIVSSTISLPANTDIGAVSYYNSQRNTLMLHTGMRDVLHITGDSVAKLPNGSGGILFPWNMKNETFIPDYGPLPNGQRWEYILFEGAFDTVVDMRPEEATALMRVWTMFILFRTAASTRPILAYIGQPGSGKSTAMRRLYRLLYGRNKEPLKARIEEHLDIASTIDPFIMIDNIDTWHSWLPDWLATTINNIDIVKRKLYSDGDVFTLKRQAIVGLTAHNPKFGREDVADRLLLITFSRLSRFGNELEMFDKIIRNRNKLWGAIVRDAQRVLREPMTTAEEAPQFRIEDFAIVGLRIARALGIESDFVSAIQAVAMEQKLFSLEEEHILVSAIKNLVLKDTKQGHTAPVERSSGLLWTELQSHSGNPKAFDRLYSNAAQLSKKLQAMQMPLSQIFTVTSKFNPVYGTKVWSFEQRNGLVPSEVLQTLVNIERDKDKEE